MSLPADTLSCWSRDDDLIAALRIVLAASTLFIISVDPAEPDRYVSTRYTVLICYVVYSIILYTLARRRNPLMPSIRAVSRWADAAWCTLLITFSSGTHSPFFFGFYFPILVASFRWDFASEVEGGT